MLKNTYVHIPGIGSLTERRIWEYGIKNWEDYLKNYEMVKVPRTKRRSLLSGVKESIEQLSAGNHTFFARRLPSGLHWRAYRHFIDKTAYVDIETTGLSAERDEITMIGVYSGKEMKTYIRGIDLEDAAAEIGKYKQLITFNGARFDLPFIEQEFPGILNHLHVDLLYPLKKLGYSGGLKRIERTLGISRSEETGGMDGFDAVRLWRKYEKGDEGSLDLLIKYNEEDVRNLERIIRMMHPKMIELEMKYSYK